MKEIETQIVPAEEGTSEVTKKIFFPKDIQEEEAIAIARSLTPLTAEGFMQNTTELPESLIQDVRNHVCRSDRLLVAHDCVGVPCAFVCSSIINIDGVVLYHLEGIIVRESLHGSGLAQKLVKEELDATNADLIGFHTQSNRMLHLGMKFADFSIELSQKYALNIHTRKMDGVVDKGRYGKCLYGDIQRFKPHAIDKIDWLNGDALICVGLIRK